MAVDDDQAGRLLVPGRPERVPARDQAVSPADVEALGLGAVPGGFQGMVLIGPSDGKVYALSLRPLLPDETA